MADDTSGAPPTGDDAMLERLAPKIHQLINSAIASQKKLSEKQRTEDRDAIAKLLDEKLTAFRPAKTEEPDEGGGKGGKGGKGDNTELATLKSQMAALAAKNEASERRASDLWQRQRESAVREQTAKYLSNAGIVGDRFDAAYALLKHTDRIKLQDDSESTDGLYSDPSTGDVTLEVGLGTWLKSEQAKIFLPPSGARGSGSRPANGQPTTKPTPEQARALVAQRLQDELTR